MRMEEKQNRSSAAFHGEEEGVGTVHLSNDTVCKQQKELPNNLEHLLSADLSGGMTRMVRLRTNK